MEEKIVKVIDDRIYDFDYYVKKLPLYLQNSDGFVEHFRIWFDVLITIVENENQILKLINVFEDNYLSIINEMDPSGNACDILDKLGSIFNVKRNFSVTYTESLVEHTDQISLNNEEFLTLIRARIIRNYSDGSYIQMNKFYQDAGLRICFYTDSQPSGTVQVHLINYAGEANYSANIQKMFRAGLLTIESMGIIYQYEVTDLETLGIWDAEVDVSGNYGWDKGVWSI